MKTQTFEEAVTRCLTSHRTLFFVQVGWGGGVANDPLHPFIRASCPVSGIVAESVPHRLTALRALYPTPEQVFICPYAIDVTGGEKSMGYFHPAAIEKRFIAPILADVSSLSMDALLQEQGGIGRHCDAAQRAFLKMLVQSVTVPCRTMDELLQEQHVTQVDLLQINAPGREWAILEPFDFDRFIPEIVHYNHRYLAEDDQHKAQTHLLSQHYQLFLHEHHTLAVRVQHPVVRVASFLRRDRQPQRALALYHHILSLEPDHIDALHGLAVTAREMRLVDEMTDALCRLKPLTPANSSMNADIATLGLGVFAAFLRYQEAHEEKEALRVLAKLLVIYPHKPLVLEHAITLFSSTGDRKQAIECAKTLLNIEPDHTLAYQTMVEHCHHPPYIQQEIVRAVTTVYQTDETAHPTLRLQRIYQAVGVLISTHWTSEHITILNALIALANTVVHARTVPKEDPVYHGFMFYRATLTSLRLPALLQPAPPPEPWPAIRFISSDGHLLDARSRRAKAASQQAEMVFFSAADPLYVVRYGKHFLSALFARCDVPFLVVIHIIGGIHRLEEIAARVGVQDERLLYSADDFDPDSVQRITYDVHRAASRELSLVVYYQSARFLWLGHILEQFALPVLVADIDQWLQRGMRDLVDRISDQDIVFHEAHGNYQLGSRLIANLLWVQPTDPGLTFARFLRYYLNEGLKHAEQVGFGAYFTDQNALVMARHHMLQGDTPSRLHTFEQLDINVGMYKTYTHNPFRFLSLYTGFDLASLPDLGDDAPPGPPQLNPPP